MKKHKVSNIAGIFAFLLVTVRAAGAVYTYNATIDISPPWNINHPTGQWDYLWLISGAPTFALRSGDTVQGTISFANNEALLFQGPVSYAAFGMQWVDWTNTIPSSVLTTTTLNGVIGSLTWSNPTSSSGVGPGYNLSVADSVISTSTSVSFTGFTYSATLVSGRGNYTPNFLSAFTYNDVPDAISVVPEPSAVGLVGTGLIMLWLTRRYRQQPLPLQF